MKRLRLPLLMGLILSMFVCSACDSGGVPVRMRIDDFTMEVDVDDMVSEALDEFRNLGLFPPETQYLPELWPESLPDVQHRMVLVSDPIPVDLTPEEGTEDYEKYKDIAAAEGAVKRIELNRLVLRVEASTLTIDLPEMFLQVADDKDADPADRLAWRTIGRIPRAEAGFVGDQDFEFYPGGESYLNAQLADETKEFAIRVRSLLEFDTTENRRLPAGRAIVRMIVVATFFIDPQGAIKAAS